MALTTDPSVTATMATTTATIQWRLKPHVHVLMTTPQHAVISWLGQRILLKSSVAEKIPEFFELLRSPKTLQALESSLHFQWSRETVEKLLTALAERKLVFSDESNISEIESFDDSSSPWWPYFNLFSSSVADWRTAIAKIEALEVTILTRMKLPADLLKQLQPTIGTPESLLEALPDHPRRLYVLILSSSDTQTLERISRQALLMGTRILPVFLDLTGAVIGPLIGPMGQPCLRCLSKRLQSGNEKVEMRLELPINHLDDAQYAWPFTSWQKLSAILQEEIFKLESALGFSPLQRGAYLFDFFNQRSNYEEVFPIPGCECSMGVKNGI
jgi:bacteriocin biosynthesis cyclodehydratase domain-containing protein